MAKEVILVVDDAELREMIAEALTQLVGIPVNSKESVLDLHKLVQESQPALVLVDLDVIDAMRCLRQLKRNPATRAVPVLALYSRGLLTCGEALRAGFDDCVDAGEISRLVERVNHYLGRDEP